MLQAIIFRDNGLTITSYGNGLAYLIRDNNADRETFIQGDDANYFRDLYDGVDAIEDASRAMAAKRHLIIEAIDYSDLSL